MRTCISTLLLILVFSLPVRADRIYIMNSAGYNTAEPQLIAAIIANGHTVDVNLVPPGTLPAGFTTACINPTTGYDWLCLFGEADYSPMLPQIKAYIDAGGKVFCQYEVSCCTFSSAGTASLLAGLTGLPIAPNVEDYIGLDFSGVPGWEASNVNGCMFIEGNAYKGLDGIPLANQFVATGGPGTPAYTVCPNFGFHFTTTDFLGTADNGAITGLGDVNAWYDGGEPISFGGTNPINPLLVDFFFPASCADTCFIFPPGCMLGTGTGPSPGTGDIHLGNDTLMCTGDVLVLNASTSGSTYLWQDGSTGPTLNVSTAGLYWVEVNSPCTGIMMDSIQVDYVPGISLDLGEDTIMCPGDIVELEAFVGSTAYLWQDGSTDSSFSTGAPGTYWVQVSTACGTTVTDSITIAHYALVSVDLGSDMTLCGPETLTLSLDTTGVISSVWQDGTNSTTYTISTAGVYWVEVTGVCNTDNDSITVTHVNVPDVDLGNDTTLCEGSVLNLAAPAGAPSYEWQDGSTGSTFTVTTDGIYWVEVGTPCGTVITDSIVVNYIDNITVDLGNDITLCEGQTVLLNATTAGAISYSWQDSTSTSTYLVTQEGTYTVEVEGACNTATGSVNVYYISPETVNFGHNDTVLCLGHSLLVGPDAAPGVTYLWQDGSTASTYLITGSGTYWMIATTAGCTYGDTLNVVFVECNPYLQMPNIFTPNGDGDNDVFRPVFMENVKVSHMAIFNRWGQELFATDEVRGGWDGKSGGNDCVEGVYFWVLTITGGLNNDKTSTHSGTVTLIR